MRLPNSAHESGPWRIREIAADIPVEDAWALPVRGSPEDFETLLRLLVASDPAEAESAPARFLWRLRDRLGGWFDLGRIAAAGEGGKQSGLTIPGTSETSLADRLPEDLRGTAADLEFASLPFEPLYRTDTEFAAEISNRTVYGVMHLAWVAQGDGDFQAQMAVYVKPRGLFGRAYMAAIKPFRHAIVYPALMRQIERTWKGRGPRRAVSA
jgi:Protein of unknown function (DUF2867)